MVSSRPASRNSINEAPVSIPIDPRVAESHGRRPNLSHRGSRDHDGHREHEYHEHGQEQDPKLFGPGFTSAPTHSAAESQVKYVLVTPDMLASIAAGQAPLTGLVQPHGTTIRDGHAFTHLDYKHGLNGDTSAGDKHEIAHLPDTHDEHALLEPEPEGPILANPIARFRHRFKEPLGEFLGTMVLIIFGNGVNCQVVLSNLTAGIYLSISFGWGIGVCFGIYACGGISGAHLNPAVTIALATWRGFPWRKVPGYALGQLLGACVGSCLVQGNYHNLINRYEGGYNVRTFGGATSTGALFFTQAQPYMSNVGAFFSEFFATAVLLGLILALGDANNNPAPAGMNGIILLWLIVGIGAALGTQTAYCLNPARDLGPRIAAAMYGYPHTIWTYRHGYFFYVPILATTCGAVFGGFVYDLLVFSGPESPMNRPWRLPWSKKTQNTDQQNAAVVA